jgi:hypothetical protein
VLEHLKPLQFARWQPGATTHQMFVGQTNWAHPNPWLLQDWFRPLTYQAKCQYWLAIKRQLEGYRSADPPAQARLTVPV